MNKPPRVKLTYAQELFLRRLTVGSMIVETPIRHRMADRLEEGGLVETAEVDVGRLVRITLKGRQCLQVADAALNLREGE